MLQRRTRYRYDVFVSYSSRNAAWVREWLVPRLKEAAVRVWTLQELAAQVAKSVTIHRTSRGHSDQAETEQKWAHEKVGDLAKTRQFERPTPAPLTSPRSCIRCRFN